MSEWESRLFIIYYTEDLPINFSDSIGTDWSGFDILYSHRDPGLLSSKISASVTSLDSIYEWKHLK